MAIYHLCIKIISRGKGKSAVAASAYRSGEKIKNEYEAYYKNNKKNITLLYLCYIFSLFAIYLNLYTLDHLEQ